MTFWLDAHIDPELASYLGSTFKIVVKSLREIGLRDAKDSVLIAAANRFRDIVIVTKDVEFFKTVERQGSPKIVLMRCGNATKIETRMYALKHFPAALEDLLGGKMCVEMPEVEF